MNIVFFICMKIFSILSNVQQDQNWSLFCKLYVDGYINLEKNFKNWLVDIRSYESIVYDFFSLKNWYC